MNRNHAAARLALAALLIACAALPAAADTYLKIPPGANYNYGTVNNLNNSLASDDIFAQMPPASATDGNHAIGNRSFAVGFTEGTHGFVKDVQFGVEYHLFPNRFGFNTAAPPTGWSGADFFEGWYSTNNGGGWTGAWFGAANRPAVDNTAVAPALNNGANDRTYVRSFTDQSRLGTWARINGSATGYGLYADLCWYKRDTPGTNTHCDMWGVANGGAYIDYIFINVLVKLTVTGVRVNPANVYQGQLNVPFLRLTLKRFSNTNFDLNAIKADVIRPANPRFAATDIDKLTFWRDMDDSGTVNAGDTLVGERAVDNLTNQWITGTPLLDNIPHNSKFLLCYDFADAAVVGNRGGMSIVNQTYLTPTHAVDAVVSEADRDVASVSTTDPNPLWPISNGTTWSTIRQRSTLSCAWNVQPPATRTIGQSFNVTLRVTNNAAGTAPAGAVNVLPVPPTITGTGLAVTSTTQYPVSIAAGSSANFTWTYYAAYPAGTVRLNSAATWTDAITGRTYTSASVQSNQCTVSTASVPVLQFTRFDAAPLELSSDGQDATVEITVRNVGGTQADGVKITNLTDTADWELTMNGTAVFAKADGPTATQDIPMGEERTFTFHYNATGAGTGYFEAKAKGTNSAAIPSSSNTVTVLSAANVQNVSMTTSPSGSIGKNGSFTVLYTVTNGGQVAATDVKPAGMTLTDINEGNPLLEGDPDPNRVTGPIPASLTLEPGETKSFSWSYNSKCGTQLGSFTLGTSATYKDALSGASRATAATATPTFTTINGVTPFQTHDLPANVRKYIAYADDSRYYAISDASILYAYDIAGNLDWQLNLTTLNTGMTVPGNAFSVTTEYDASWNPLYNVIWVGTNQGRVYAIKDNLTAGAGFWAPAAADSWTSLGTGDSVTTGPVVWADHIYCAAGNRLAKRTKENGTFPIGWGDYTFPNTVTTAPSIDNNNIYVGCANQRLYAVNAATGTLVSASSALGASVVGSPFVYQGVIFTSTAGGKLVRFGSTSNLTQSVTEVTLSAGATMSDVWVSFSNDYVYVTNTGANLYVRKFSDLTAHPTVPVINRVNETLYAPIEWANIIYCNSATSGGAGNVHAFKKSDGANLSAYWPYSTGMPCRTPSTVDAFNSVLGVGCDFSGTANRFEVIFLGLPSL